MGSRKELAEIPAAGEAELAEPEKFVALTFDDGPKRETTATLLDGLRQRGASATFFSDWKANCGKSGFGRTDEGGRGIRWAITPGIMFGWVQLPMPRWYPRRFKRRTHCCGRSWGRDVLAAPAPWGDSGDAESTDSGAHGHLDGRLPGLGISEHGKRWYRKFLKDVKPNSIILMHDIFPTSIGAALRDRGCAAGKGYWFVTVEELLALNGVTAKPGVLYRKIG